MLFNCLGFICFLFARDWLLLIGKSMHLSLMHQDKNHNIIFVQGILFLLSVCLQRLAEWSLDLDLDFLLNFPNLFFLLFQLPFKSFRLLSDLLDFLWGLWISAIFFIFIIRIITWVNWIKFWVGLVVSCVLIGFKFLFVNFLIGLLLFFFLWRLFFFLFRNWRVLLVLRGFKRIIRLLDWLRNHDRRLGNGLNDLFRLSYHLWLKLNFLNLLGIVGGWLWIWLILLVLIGVSLCLWNFLIRLTIKYMSISLVSLEGNESQDKEDKDIKVIKVDKNHGTR